MTELSCAPDIATLEVPTDAWTQPFWDATAEGRLVFPRCDSCNRFRWPPGPFCPACRSQAVQWVAPGAASIYSFTIVREMAEDGAPVRFLAPALVEFAGVEHVRLLAAIVDAPLDEIRIGAPLEVGWSQAADAVMPVFRVVEAAGR